MMPPVQFWLGMKTARKPYKKRSTKKVIQFPTSEISSTSSSPTITDSDTDNDGTSDSSLFEDEDELE